MSISISISISIRISIGICYLASIRYSNLKGKIINIHVIDKDKSKRKSKRKGEMIEN